MSRRYVSAQGRALFLLSQDVRNKIWEKNNGMDRERREVLIETLIQRIHEIDALLRHQSVRGHLNPTILTPEVDEHSSINELLLRLKRQAHAASILADVAHLGPAANAEEQAALSGVERVLYVLDEAISPVSSLEGSATESD